MSGCKEKIFRDYHSYPCNRDAVLDGWCKQHHPDAKAARRKASDDRYNATWAAKTEAKQKYEDGIRQAARRAALEEAAKVAEGETKACLRCSGRIAAAIRKLA